MSGSIVQTFDLTISLVGLPAPNGPRPPGTYTAADPAMEGGR